MLLLDLQKAFDTVDHSIILIKLEASGLGNDILVWFKSYLSDRTQLVDLSGTHSSCSPITCGVHQGSILGPLLFLITSMTCQLLSKTKQKSLRNLSGRQKQARYRTTFNRRFILLKSMVD